MGSGTFGALMSSVAMDVVGAVRKYSAADANADIKKMEKRDATKCNAGTIGAYGGVGGSLDKFVSVFPDMESVYASTKLDQALSFIPSSLFRGGYLRRMLFNMALEQNLKTVKVLAEKEIKANETEKKKIKNVDILSKLLAVSTDSKEKQTQLFIWSFLAGGKDFAKFEELAARAAGAGYVQKPGLTTWTLQDEKLRGEVASVRHHITPDAALIVSLVYYLAAKEAGKCEKGEQKSTEALGFMQKAQLWANIARMAHDPEVALDFMKNEHDFKACNTPLINTKGEDKNAKSTRSKGFVQLAQALIHGIYECGAAKQFSDNTYTRLYVTTPNHRPSRMECDNDDSSHYFSRSANAVVALWRSARYAAMGCFGEMSDSFGPSIPPQPGCKPPMRETTTAEKNAGGPKCVPIDCGSGKVRKPNGTCKRRPVAPPSCSLTSSDCPSGTKLNKGRCKCVKKKLIIGGNPGGS